MGVGLGGGGLGGPRASGGWVAVGRCGGGAVWWWGGVVGLGGGGGGEVVR